VAEFIFLIELMTYGIDLILTIGAFKNTFTAHGTRSYNAWAVVAIFLAFGGWLMDAFVHSTHRLRQRQLWYRIVRLAIASSFRIWSHFSPGTGNTMVSKQLVAGAGCNLGAVFHTYLRDYWIQKLTERFWEDYVPFKLQYTLLDRQESVGEQAEARGRFEDKFQRPWPESRKRAWHVPARRIQLTDKKPVVTDDVENNICGGSDHEVADFLFSRCYCCLGLELTSRALPLVTPTTQKSSANLAAWRKGRALFLDQKPLSHFGDVRKLSSRFLPELRPHRLCAKCEIMCGTSPLIKSIIPAPRISGMPAF
jgi:hypothetical protein